MNGEVLNLDWRDAPPFKEMLQRLFSLLMDIDGRGVARLIASSGLNGRQYARLRKGDSEKEQVNRGSQMLCIDRNGTIVPETQPYSTRWNSARESTKGNCKSRYRDFLCALNGKFWSDFKHYVTWKMFDCKDGSWSTEYTWRATYETEWRARDESIKDIFVGIVRGYNHALKIAYQDSRQALQQQIAQAFSEKKGHANKLEEVTRREQNLRAQVS